jgi:hypothetical protein
MQNRLTSPSKIYYSNSSFTTPTKSAPTAVQTTPPPDTPTTPNVYNRSMLSPSESVTVTPLKATEEPPNQETDDIEDLLLNVDEDSLLEQYQNQQIQQQYM